MKSPMAAAVAAEGKRRTLKAGAEKQKFVAGMRALRSAIKYGRNCNRTSPRRNGFLSDGEYSGEEFKKAIDTLPLHSHRLRNICKVKSSYEWNSYTNDTTNEWQKHNRSIAFKGSRTVANQMHRVAHYHLAITRLVHDTNAAADSLRAFAATCTGAGLVDLGGDVSRHAQALSEAALHQKDKSFRCLGTAIKKYISRYIKGNNYRAYLFFQSLVSKKVKAKKKNKLVRWVNNTDLVIKAVARSQKDFLEVHRGIVLKYLSTDQYGTPCNSLYTLKRMMAAFAKQGEQQSEETERLKRAMWVFAKIFNDY